MSDDDDVKGKVVRLLSGTVPDRPARGRAKPATFSVRGAGNVVAGRDIHIKTERIVHRTRVVVTPGVGVVDAGQKARLKELIDRWVALDRLVSRKQPISWASAWSALNKKMRVNSYHELPSEMFLVAVKFIEQHIARLNRTPTARKRSPTWRASRVRAIQARCSQKGIQEWRCRFMVERFGKASITDMDNDELEILYSAVMAR